MKAWEEYPLERMSSVWRLLYASYKGIVEDDGGNAYSHHRGSRKAHTRLQKQETTMTADFQMEKLLLRKRHCR